MKRLEGFTTIELVVTLFIALIFILAGNQLYVTSIRDSARTTRFAIASNAAYTDMRTYSTNDTYIKAPACVDAYPINNALVTVEGLANARRTITITCPYYQDGDRSVISKVTVTYSYDTPDGERESVSHATLTSPTYFD